MLGLSDFFDDSDQSWRRIKQSRIFGLARFYRSCGFCSVSSALHMSADVVVAMTDPLFHSIRSFIMSVSYVLQVSIHMMLSRAKERSWTRASNAEVASLLTNFNEDNFSGIN